MDGSWVRGRAGEVRALADDVRALGTAAAAAAGAQWHCVAAGEFRNLLAADAARLAGVAAALDDVVAALDAHARALDAVPDPAVAVAAVGLQLARLL